MAGLTSKRAKTHASRAGLVDKACAEDFRDLGALQALEMLASLPARLRLSLARAADLPAGLFSALAADAHPGVRRALASREDLSPTQLCSLARDPDQGVLRALLAQPQADALSLDELLRHGDDWIRAGVAAHPGASPAQLARLAKDSNPCVRAAVARHPQAPAAALRALAQDPDPGIRLALAGHPQASNALQAHLARDPVVRVRIEVASSCLNEAVLKRLARDAVPEVRRTVAARASLVTTLQRVARDLDASIRRQVAANSAASPGILSQLAQDRDSDIRALVAARTSCDPSLRALARDSESRVRLAVLRNPGLTAELREAVLAEGGNLDLMLQLSADPRSPAELLESLADRADCDSLRRNLLYHPAADAALIRQVMAQEPGLTLQLSLAADPHTPRVALEYLAAGTCSFELKARLRLNPALPEALRARLDQAAEGPSHGPVTPEPRPRTTRSSFL